MGATTKPRVAKQAVAGLHWRLAARANDADSGASIGQRMSLLVRRIVGERNDWRRLEELTGLKAVKWRHTYAGVTKPSLEMFEALCRLHPEHAFWLATGLIDESAGHTAAEADAAHEDD
ncbi:hypothetical protein AK36_6127 (plasmid) [Burkholderia vietnamiensis LMG 10929]|nr:hypothetical protein AK36_6127 [Burkholderia vietnamiensis LMG 10929]